MITTMGPIGHLKKASSRPAIADMRNVAAIVLGGGQGTRLYPLTCTRCKPAICFGGSFRLIDAALSNAIHSLCHKIFVITQFLSSSLHKHICTTYQGNNVFSHGFIDLLTAEQTPSGHHWFQGTADAVRQNLYHLAEAPVDYFLILSGDQLYNMDFSAMVAFAQQNEAEVVVGALPVNGHDAKRMGIMLIDDDSRITHFAEKPQHEELLDTLKLNSSMRKRFSLNDKDSRSYLGSMGIYLFKRKTLIKLLEEDEREDFGKHLLPRKIEEGNTFAFIHRGYWEDIGTIRSFYDANMALTHPNPPFNCYDEYYPMIKAPSKLPGAKIEGAQVNHSIICEGSLIAADEVSNSILGPRSVIQKGCVIRDSYVMGNDFYRPPTSAARFPSQLQISKGCHIERAIIDKDVYIGEDVQLVNRDRLAHYDGEQIFIREGIIIVPRGASIPNGFSL